MDIPDVAEKWVTEVHEVTIGATAEEGGTRERTITIGGAKSIPFMKFEGEIGNRPVIAVDVWDTQPDDWPEVLKEPYSDVLDNPAEWAKRAVEYGADLVCLKLNGLHPETGDKAPEAAVEAVLAVKEAVKVPLLVWGCGQEEKDNAAMPKVSEALKGERALLAAATQDNYKTLTAVCQADGHCIITEAPLDINIGKQVNILISEMGFPLDRIVMYQNTGALGYGIEYAYSIQERARIAALSQDRMMMQPVLVNAGHEAWRAKESKTTQDDIPEWGDHKIRGILWEAVTATVLLQSGADLIRMIHPEAVKAVKKHIDLLVE